MIMSQPRTLNSSDNENGTVQSTLSGLLHIDSLYETKNIIQACVIKMTHRTHGGTNKME